MDLEDRVKALESEVEYLRKIVENHILEPASGSEDRKKQVQDVIQNTLTIFERHPAFSTPESKAMLKDIMKPMMKAGGTK
jgi:hypothetical protein